MFPEVLLDKNRTILIPFDIQTTVFLLLFSAELKPCGYYLEHVFNLDHVIFTNMSHVYYLDW